MIRTPPALPPGVCVVCGSVSSSGGSPPLGEVGYCDCCGRASRLVSLYSPSLPYEDLAKLAAQNADMILNHKSDAVNLVTAEIFRLRAILAAHGIDPESGKMPS